MDDQRLILHGGQFFWTTVGSRRTCCHLKPCGDGCQIIPQKDTPKIEVTMEPDEESNYTSEEK